MQYWLADRSRQEEEMDKQINVPSMCYIEQCRKNGEDKESLELKIKKVRKMTEGTLRGEERTEGNMRRGEGRKGERGQKKV